MKSNTCGKCEHYKGKNTTCKEGERDTVVTATSPMCIFFDLKEDQSEQSEWAKKATQSMQDWKDKRLSEKWNY